MTCLSLGFLEYILIWVIVVAAVIALIQLILPRVLSPPGQPVSQGLSILFQALNIIMWAVICIGIVVVVFDLLACMTGLPPIRR